MSYAVVRGRPVEAQLYLDKVLENILREGCTRPGVKCKEDINLIEVIYYCMKKKPDEIRVINGATGDKFTNEQILKRAALFARALKAKGATGKTVIIMLRNHEHMSALYYAVLLAGTVPFMMEPSSTEYEIQNFLTIVSPVIVFCESDSYNEIINVVQKSDIKPEVVIADGPSLDKFAEGQEDDVDSFQLPDVDPETTAILLPTSGSTGLPKAAMMSHRGLTIQLASSWYYHTKFPHPTRLALLLSTGQWMTHTVMLTSCPVYRLPVLLTSKNITAEHVAELWGKYQPTWTLMSPALAVSLGQVATPDQLASCKVLCIGGSPFAPESITCLKAKLPESAVMLNVYGLTELEGFVSMGWHSTPLASAGRIVNLIDYKLVNEDGEEILEPKKKGELYLKSKAVLKGYLKNKTAFHESVTADGWLKTGDVFYRDEEHQLFFINRSKFGFKYLNHQVFPEELEAIIGSIPGVQQCVACGLDAGPAAAVVLQPGYEVTRETIHKAVKSTLSDYKQLRGGIAFVESLPKTHSGKINRKDCLQMLQDLVKTGDCI